MAGKNSTPEIKFTYKKRNDNQVFYVDGLFGGLTPKGMLYIDLFQERMPTPKEIRFNLTDEGRLGEEIERNSIAGVVRDVQCGLVMNMDTALAIKNWLDDRIKEMGRISAKEGMHK